MRHALLAALGIGATLGLLYLLKKRSGDVMSDQWLQRQKQGERDEFHGPSWNWDALRRNRPAAN